MHKLRISLLMAAVLAVAVGCDEKGDDASGLRVNVLTGLASDVDVSSANLLGTYSRANAPIREAGFEWGESEISLTEVLQAPATDTPFSALLDCLGEEKTYWYRAYIILQKGSEIKYFYGETKSFTTLKEEDAPEPVIPVTPPEPDNPDNPPGPDDPPGSDTPDIPTPSGSNLIGWYELPLMPLAKSGEYYYNASDNTQYYAWHMCTGGEKGPGGKTARNYTVCYSGKYHCPVWVAAPRHSMYVGSSGRNDSYRRDDKIPSDIQYSSTSTGDGCNKGHMLGSAERTSSKATNRDVFYYPNIAPQLATGFNTGGGGWNTLEDWVDLQVCSDTLYVVIGCYFDAFKDGYDVKTTPKIISFGGRDDVHMPTMFYYILLRTKKGNSGKALKDCSASELQCAAFVRAHSNSLKGQKVTSKEMMSVSALEELTGVTYFPSVPNAPKSTYSASDWGL